MRSSSPLFSTLNRSISPIASQRRPPNHTTYWIRFGCDGVAPDLTHDEFMKKNVWKKYVDYLRQLKAYNYILICDREGSFERLNLVIQYQEPTVIDLMSLPVGTIIRESPMRLRCDEIRHELKLECKVIEEGGNIDYELIDKHFALEESLRMARSTSPIPGQRK